MERHRPCRAATDRGIVTADDVLADMIAKAAARTVKENEKTGARFASWMPLPEDLGSDAVSRDPVFAPAANL